MIFLFGFLSFTVFGQIPSMNQRLDESWTLISARYRDDIREQRLIYANEIAIKDLNGKKRQYSDGAAFGKIAFSTVSDSQFPASRRLGNQRRFQVMIKDSKKYKKTMGWGYALTMSAGDDDHPENLQQACHSCHELVSDRDYVFTDGNELQPNNGSLIHPLEKNLKFIDRSLAQLPSQVGALVTKKSKNTFRSLEGKIRKYFFVGTLYEIQSLLVSEVKKSKEPTFFFSEDTLNVTGFIPAKDRKETQKNHCKSPEESLLMVQTTPTQDGTLNYHSRWVCR